MKAQSDSTRRCAITGASGYVGGLLAHRLVGAGWDVVKLVRRTEAGDVAFRLGDPVAPEALHGCTALVHCAYDFAPLGWNEIRSANVDGTAKLLEAARLAGVRRITLISTISAFEGCRSLYGRAKLETERVATSYDACVIRPGLVYSDDAGGMFGRLASQAKSAVIIPMPGGGNQLQYLVHQDDLAAAVLASLDKPSVPSTAVTVAHSEPWTFSEIIRSMALTHDRHPLVVPLPWRFVWLGLRTAELAGVRLGVRSDSLISLIYQNPAPIINAAQELGIECRPFAMPLSPRPKISGAA